MALKNYSLLKGKITDFQEERDYDTPHFQVRVNANDISYRIAVNVMSAAEPPTLKYIVVSDFRHALTDKLEEFEDGIHRLKSEKNGVALDYIRGNLFDINDMKLIPHDLSGPNNDLNDLLAMYTKRSMAQEDARIYAFGEQWPSSDQTDQYFHFKPQGGIHDIHMNQGNSGSWMRDNGVYQDGALLFHFPQTGQWAGVFLAFQSQAIHTDDHTGNPLETSHEELSVKSNLRIVSALINPAGDDPGKENVSILNVSNEDVDLTGWTLKDQRKETDVLPEQILKPGEFFTLHLSGNHMQLSNKGGQITLITPKGLKAHGVSYNKNQIQQQGWTLVF